MDGLHQLLAPYLVGDLADPVGLMQFTHLLDVVGTLLGEEREPSGQVEEREAKRRPEEQEKFTNAPTDWTLGAVSPWDLVPDLSGYRPTARWHHDPATPAQLQVLQRFGMDLPRSLTWFSSNGLRVSFAPHGGGRLGARPPPQRQPAAAVRRHPAHPRAGGQG